MKRIILCAVLVLFSSSVMAKWVKIDDFVGDGRNVFVAADNIKKIGNRAVMWTLINYEKPIHSALPDHQSTMELVEYDCKDKKYRVLAYYYHTERDAEGDVFYKEEAPDYKMRPVLEKSNEMEAWKMACGKGK